MKGCVACPHLTFMRLKRLNMEETTLQTGANRNNADCTLGKYMYNVILDKTQYNIRPITKFDVSTYLLNLIRLHYSGDVLFVLTVNNWRYMNTLIFLPRYAMPSSKVFTILLQMPEEGTIIEIRKMNGK